MIKSLFNLSLTGTDSSTSSTATSISGDQDSKSSPGRASSAAAATNATSVRDVNLATDKSSAERKFDVTAGDAEQNDEEDEEAIKEAVQAYAEEERLAPFRTKQLLKKALKPAPPDEPDPSVSILCNEDVRNLFMLMRPSFLSRNVVAPHAHHALRICGGKKSDYGRQREV